MDLVLIIYAVAIISTAINAFDSYTRYGLDAAMGWIVAILLFLSMALKAL